jgi:hypothetical protein
MEELNGPDRLCPSSFATDAIVPFRIDIIDADADLEGIGRLSRERGEGVGHCVIDQGAIG